MKIDGSPGAQGLGPKLPILVNLAEAEIEFLDSHVFIYVFDNTPTIAEGERFAHNQPTNVAHLRK